MKVPGRGRLKKVLRKFTKASAHPSSLIRVDVGVHDQHSATADVQTTSLYTSACVWSVQGNFCDRGRRRKVRGRFRKPSTYSICMVVVDLTPIKLDVPTIDVDSSTLYREVIAFGQFREVFSVGGGRGKYRCAMSTGRRTRVRTHQATLGDATPECCLRLLRRAFWMRLSRLRSRITLEIVGPTVQCALCGHTVLRRASYCTEYSEVPVT